MKMIVVFSALLVLCLAAPQRLGDKIDGNMFAYEAKNGISKKKDEALQSVGNQNNYLYTDADGVVYTVQYVPDADGFKPRGVHSPKQGK
ncbi:cuticle protein CP14.6-like [Cylas formicarius]|uniref:cuticle protein CP14.6-like n=1 Tax=Cylas formicarius TaxID=197179 RepID=UPI0029589E5A|nr:cuticle protein CP14.6-like [Cylas formicarius]XP_060517600.1 cuticle protein CP14.6-like [Cylas formicarius]XP_060518651.1 cuticle protein CP14.6-like [Cylas formicarius]